MQPKRKTPIDKGELNEFLRAHPTDVIWHQKAESSHLVRDLILYSISSFLIYFKMGLMGVIFLMTLLIPIIIAYRAASSMNYYILPDRIIFKWGFFKKSTSAILFENITAINLVQYRDSDLSTIHFGTRGKYHIKKINLKDGSLNLYITFDNIYNGEKTYELLMTLWENQKEKLELKEILKQVK